MFVSVNDFKGFKVATGGQALGRCKDLVLDVRLWVAPYLVVEIGNLLSKRQVMVPSVFFRHPEPETRRIPVELDPAKIEKGPALDLKGYVTAQDERKLLEHYSLRPYWLKTDARPRKEKAPLIRPLYRAGEVLGTPVRASDGEIGHLADFLIEKYTWVVRYVIVDTRNWLPGRQVCLALNACVRGIDPETKQLVVDLPRELIWKSPEYNPVNRISREYQMVLHDYYGWPKYWEQEPLRSIFAR